jgi:addiction module HigA family antidote
MIEDKLTPIHPGEVLLEEFIKPMNLSVLNITKSINVPVSVINNLIEQKCSINANLALRLARYFNMSPQFWLGLQMDYDLDITQDELGEDLIREVAVLTS